MRYEEVLFIQGERSPPPCACQGTSQTAHAVPTFQAAKTGESQFLEASVPIAGIVNALNRTNLLLFLATVLSLPRICSGQCLLIC